MLCCTWPGELGWSAVQGSLDSHQICEQQQPSSSGKALQSEEQQLGGCPPHSPEQGCSEGRAAPRSLYTSGESRSQDGSAHKVSPRRAWDMLGFCFVTWWLRWAQISEVSIATFQRHVCVPVAYTVSKNWISGKILFLQIITIANLWNIFQIIVTLTCDKFGLAFMSWKGVTRETLAPGLHSPSREFGGNVVSE